MYTMPLMDYSFNYQSFNHQPITNVRLTNGIIQNQNEVQQLNGEISMPLPNYHSIIDLSNDKNQDFLSSRTSIKENGTTKHGSKSNKNEKSSKKYSKHVSRVHTSTHDRKLSRQSSAEMLPKTEPPALRTSRSAGDYIQRERKSYTMAPLAKISGPSASPAANMFAKPIAPTDNGRNKSKHSKRDIHKTKSVSYQKSDADITDDEDDDTPIIVKVRYDPNEGAPPAEDVVRKAVDNQLKQQSDNRTSNDPIVVNYFGQTTQSQGSQIPLRPQQPVFNRPMLQVQQQPINRPSSQIPTVSQQQLQQQQKLQQEQLKHQQLLQQQKLQLLQQQQQQLQQQKLQLLRQQQQLEQQELQILQQRQLHLQQQKLHSLQQQQQHMSLQKPPPPPPQLAQQLPHHQVSQQQSQQQKLYSLQQQQIPQQKPPPQQQQRPHHQFPQQQQMSHHQVPQQQLHHCQVPQSQRIPLQRPPLHQQQLFHHQIPQQLPQQHQQQHLPQQKPPQQIHNCHQQNPLLPPMGSRPARPVPSIPSMIRPPQPFLQNSHIRPLQVPRPLVNQHQFRAIRMQRLPNRNISSAWNSGSYPAGLDTFRPISFEMATGQQPTTVNGNNAMNFQQNLPRRPNTAPSSSDVFRPPPVSDIPELSRDNLLSMLNQIPDLQGRQFNIEYLPTGAPEGYPIPFNLDVAGNTYPEPVVIDQLPNNVIQHVKSSNNPALAAALEATMQRDQYIRSVGPHPPPGATFRTQPATVMHHAAHPNQQVQQSRPVSSNDSDSSTEVSSSDTSSSSSSSSEESEGVQSTKPSNNIPFVGPLPPTSYFPNQHR